MLADALRDRGTCSNVPAMVDLRPSARSLCALSAGACGWRRASSAAACTQAKTAFTSAKLGKIDPPSSASWSLLSARRASCRSCSTTQALLPFGAAPSLLLAPCSRQRGACWEAVPCLYLAR